MNITIIHGQSHKGITYTMSKELLGHLTIDQDEVKEFFLPKEGPAFCCGCNNCFIKGEEHCPAALEVQPMAKAMEWADIIILDSPNYVMEMSGAMKNFMDHLAYRWITHRPYGGMFTKVGITLSSSAGAPPKGVVKSMAKQLKWMGVSKVYTFGLISNAMGVHDLSEEKRKIIHEKTETIAKAVKQRAAHPHPSLRGKLFFFLFRRMQKGATSSWNPTDLNWWSSQGWTEKNRPWKNSK